MTCTCCETVACCTDATCNSVTRSECVGRLSGTPNTVVGTCDPFVCLDVSGRQSCSLVNACACAATSSDHRTRPTVQPPTCNCTTLSSLGFTAGGCRWYLCEQCVSGNCTNQCAFPRECCAGTCCPLSQRCVSNTCVNKCATGTFCAGTGSAFACCGADTKCCGSSGCLAYTPLGTGGANFTSDKDPTNGGDGWYDTGVDLAAGVVLTIEARGDSANGTFTHGDNTNVTPEGLPDTTNRFDNAFNFLALLGKVGSSVFLVGSSYSGSPGAGRLYLRMNREIYATGASTGGSLIITFNRKTDPCPGYTPASVGEPVVHGVPVPPGPGAALKDILKLGGIVASETCSCNARAAKMDEWGGGECIRRRAEIVGWLQEEAEKRGMWLWRTAGYALVLAAVLLAALKRPFRGNNK